MSDSLQEWIDVFLSIYSQYLTHSYSRENRSCFVIFYWNVSNYYWPPNELGWVWFVTKVTVFFLIKSFFSPLPFLSVPTEVLRTASTLLAGSIPSELGRCSRLTYLGLENSLLVGTLPSEIGTLSDLQILYVSINRLTGTVPTEYANLTKLKEFSIFGNDIPSSIPSGMCDEGRATVVFSDEKPQSCSCCSLAWKKTRS